MLIIIFIILINNIEINTSQEQLKECSKKSPIIYNNECLLKFCTNLEIEIGECIISNNIIKIQWLNNIISIGKLSYKYINLFIDKQNNLIIFTYPYYGEIMKELKKSRIFYGIKSDGGPLLFNSTMYSLEFKFNIILGYYPEKNIFKFYDNNTHNDYAMFLVLEDIDEDYRKVYDYDNFKLKGGDIMTFFEDIRTNKRYYFETLDGKNEILIVYNSLDKLLFKGINYYFNDEISVFAHSYFYLKEVRDTPMCSCIRIRFAKFEEDSLGCLGCFFINQNGNFLFYLMKLNYDFTVMDDFISVFSSLTIDYNNTQENNKLFYKCILLKDIIIPFLYFTEENKLFLKVYGIIERENNTDLVLKMNALYNFNISNGINSFYESCDLIKINDNSFLFSTTTIDNLNLLLIFFDLYNNYNNLFIRKYEISLELYNLKYYTSLRCTIFNNFIGLAFSAYNYSIDVNNSFTFFTLLGYVNSTNPSPIRDLFGQKEKFVFEIKKYINIENNIFGYELIGIIINNFNELKNIGIIFYDSSDNLISQGIVPYEIDNIIFKKDQISGIPFGKYFFNFSGIASEPKNYNDFIKYIDNTSFFEQNNNEEEFKEFYEPNNFTGKSSVFIFEIDSCYKTCSECQNILGNKNMHFCTICREGYIKNENNTCELKEVETIENGECPENYPFLYKESNLCKKDCEINNLFNNICILNNLTKELEQDIINKIEESIMDNTLDNVLDNITNGNGEDLRINLKNIKYHISSTFRQFNIEYSDISSIKLGECENILKQKYKNIDNNESLLILKIDAFIDSSPVPIVIYDVFHPKTKEKLNLTYCKGKQIEIIYPVNINESELFKYNQSSEFYSDV